MSDNDNRNHSDIDDDLAAFLKRQFEALSKEELPIEETDDPLDRRHFILNAQDFDPFAEVLENPPEPSEGFRRFMANTPRWEHDKR